MVDSPVQTHRLLGSAAIRQVETRGLQGTAPGTLMQRAAQALADGAELRLLGMPPGTPVLAFCGPGNNGADALLATMLLRQRGFPVAACELDGAHASERIPADAARVRSLAREQGLLPRRITTTGELSRSLAIDDGGPQPGLRRPPLVIDGLFGIGLTRPLQGLAAEFCRLLAGARLAVISVDVPSGINADTGALVGGKSGVAVRALETVTMIADKPGLRTGAARDHGGSIRVASLGLEDCIEASIGTRTEGCGQLIDRLAVRHLLPERPRDSSKGMFGTVAILGGARGMTGAALLAARGAQSSGAGKILIVSPDEPVFDPGQPQLMSRDASQGIADARVVVVGCGLGTGARAQALLEAALAHPGARVLDADALNAMASRQPTPAPHGACTVLTPHPLEAARLLGTDVAAIQADRIGSACAIAKRWSCLTVLKGAGSVLASAEGRWAILEPGGPALASAGSGDVLAGVIGGLLAQGLDAWDAATLGCWAHAAAADEWSNTNGWSGGLSAAELPLLIRRTLSDLS